MKIFDWKELVSLAQHNSPFYRQLYGERSFSCLSEVPIVSQSDFWKANTVRNNRVLSAPMTDGIIFKSGGTTGNPKFSIYTHDEWNLFTRVFGEAMCKAGLSTADRIADLFYVGELYASFIFIMKSIEAAPFASLQFPIGGATKPEVVMKTVSDFQINVLAGLPTTILNLAEFYAQNPSRYPDVCINKVMFGGESMYADQRGRLEEIFPGLKIVSIGYASVDGGLLGYADSTCGPEEHRAFGSHTVMEIVDEDTLEPIEEVDRPGKLLVTNLIRGLMPCIRYPVGDRAVWVEPANPDNPDRKFVIFGRSEEAARVGPVSIYYEDMRAFLTDLDLIPITGFQMIITHRDKKDGLTLRIATPDALADQAEVESTIAQEFGLQRPMFAEAIRDNKIHPLTIEWIDSDEVVINARTGKLRRVIDYRQSGS